MILFENLSYDPESGIFRWITAGRGRNRIRAGFINPDGYRRISIAKRNYLEQRLAWLAIYGRWPSAIDHINGIRDDNRISNLREATKMQNAANSRVRSDSALRLKGVRYHSTGKAWQARITVGGKQLHLGMFSSKEDAHAAYCTAAKNYFGEFFNSGATP